MVIINISIKKIENGFIVSNSYLEDEKKYWAKEKPKEEREKEIYEEKKHKAELKMLDIVNKYPEIKETYFQKEEEDLDE